MAKKTAKSHAEKGRDKSQGAPPKATKRRGVEEIGDEVEQAEFEMELEAEDADDADFGEEQALRDEGNGNPDLETPEYIATHDEAGEDEDGDFKNGEDLGDERKKVHIEFTGSEILRAKAPRVFEFAETVAEEWVNDGDFHALPVGHPLAQYALSEGLKRAKKVEKKLEEKGVFIVAKIGVDYLKTKMKR